MHNSRSAVKRIIWNVKGSPENNVEMPLTSLNLARALNFHFNSLRHQARSISAKDQVWTLTWLHLFGRKCLCRKVLSKTCSL